MFAEYPKQLYRSGWEDLSDAKTVFDADEEKSARAEGFKSLTEEAEPVKRGRKPKAE